MAIKIGELARLTCTSAPTIRYYEEVGLLPTPGRRSGGQRCYGDEDVRRLTFVRRCRDFALPIKQVQLLLTLMEDGDRSCDETRDVARGHLEVLRARIVELEALERVVVGLVQSCDSSRTNAPDESCEGWREVRA